MDYFNLFKTILTACECREFFSTFWLAFMLKIKDIPVEGAAGTTPPPPPLGKLIKAKPSKIRLIYCILGVNY